LTRPSSSAHNKIAFIGLGKMGLAMASRLVSAGYDIRGFDVSKNACDAFLQIGGKVSLSVVDAVKGSDLLITMLPDGVTVSQVVLGEKGAVSVMGKGTFLIDMSSSAPLETRALGAELAKDGLKMMDAPVSGGVAKAVDGTLTVMVGGDADILKLVKPILINIGNSVIYTGGLGSGHAAKALNNFVSAAGLSAACEAVLIGKEFGIDPSILVDVMNQSTGRNNSTQVKLKPHILSGLFGSGFSMELMTKDLKTAAELAHKLNVPQRGADYEAELWSLALKSLVNGADHTEIFCYLESRLDMQTGKSADSGGSVLGGSATCRVT
jgi:3-hydroxyisobutyrate dehydrogenase